MDHGVASERERYEREADADAGPIVFNLVGAIETQHEQRKPHDTRDMRAAALDSEERLERRIEREPRAARHPSQASARSGDGQDRARRLRSAPRTNALLRPSATIPHQTAR